MTLPQIAASIINFINGVLVPLVFALAFAMFLFGVFRFFFVKPGDAAARKEGRGFIVGAVVAFAVMLSVWGLVNLIKNSVYLNNNQPPLPTFNGSTGGASGVSPNGVSPNGGVSPNSGVSPNNNNRPTNGTTGSDPTDTLF